MISVMQMMALPPFSEAKIMAGFNGISRAIEYINILDSDAALKTVRANELVLCSDSSNLTLPISVPLIKNLIRHRACGLGIKLYYPLNPIPSDVIELCNLENFPVFVLPASTAWQDVFSQYFYLLNSIEQPGEKYVYAEIFEDLLNALPKCQDYIDIIEYASTALDTPCILVGKGIRKDICFPTDFFSDFEVTERMLTEPDEHIIHLLEGSVFYCERHDLKGNVLFCPIQFLQYEYMIFYNVPPVADLKSIYGFCYATLLIKSFLQRKEDRQHSKLQTISLLIEKTIVLQKFDVSLFEEQLRSLNISLYPEYAVGVCKYSHSVDTGVYPIDDAEILSIFDYLLDHHEILGCYSSAHRLYFLIPLIDLTLMPLQKIQYLRKNASQIVRLLENKNGGLKFSFGIGSTNDYKDGLQESLQEANDALLYGEKFSPEKQIYHLYDVSIYRLLFSDASERTIKKFIMRYFSYIFQLEDKQQEKLLYTLNIYLESHFNARECARKLNIHYNTVKNRLEQIFTLTGLDPFNSNDILVLKTCLDAMILFPHLIRIPLK